MCTEVPAVIGVIVLGGSGMLGSMVTDVLSRDPALGVSATVRSRKLLEEMQSRFPRAAWRLFDAQDSAAATDLVAGCAWIINCIGVIKQVIHDENACDVERAITVNAMLPHRLAAAAVSRGTRVIQIATDCVYSGTRGAYKESDPHDALDVYGKTKSLGEIRHPLVHHLRCSIVGPELKEFRSLLEWFRRQPRRARINGFTNHLWNGVTTYHFARACAGILKSGLPLSSLQHMVPADAISKDGLLREFARCFDRADIEIEGTAAAAAVDRTLATDRPDVNLEIWRAAGYDRPPSIRHMLHELATHVHAGAAPGR